MTAASLTLHNINIVTNKEEDLLTRTSYRAWLAYSLQPAYLASCLEILLPAMHDRSSYCGCTSLRKVGDIPVPCIQYA